MNDRGSRERTLSHTRTENLHLYTIDQPAAGAAGGNLSQILHFSLILEDFYVLPPLLLDFRDPVLKSFTALFLYFSRHFLGVFETCFVFKRFTAVYLHFCCLFFDLVVVFLSFFEIVVDRK